VLQVLRLVWPFLRPSTTPASSFKLLSCLWVRFALSYHSSRLLHSHATPYIMADQQKTGPGGHYSGHNPIPTVKQFIENLDKDKKNRDAELDQQAAAGKTPQGPVTAKPSVPGASGGGGAQPHQMQKRSVDGTEKTVTDPVTGNQVTISDVDKAMMSEVDNPHLVIPNANLQKSTVCGRQVTPSPEATNILSLSKPTRTSHSKTTNTARTSQRRPILSPKGQPQTYLFMARRQTCYSTQHRLSAMNRHSQPWRNGLPFYALGSWWSRSSLAKSLVEPSRA
jgi:hypothetical protein